MVLNSISTGCVACTLTTKALCGAGKLFAVGGVDKKYVKLRSVESYDPNTGVWSPEPDMLTARSNCGVEEAAVSR